MTLFLTKFKISTRLGVSFALLLVLLGAIAVSAVANLQRSSDFSHKLVTEDVAQGVLAAQVQSLAQQSSLNLLLILNTQDRDKRVALYKTLDSDNANLDEILNTLAMRDGEMASPELAQIISLREAYQREFLQTVDFVEWDPESAITQFEEKTRPALTRLLSTIEEYLSEQNAATLNKFAQVQSSSERSIKLTVVLAALAIAIGVLLSLLVSRSIVKPLQQAVITAQRMSKGDLRFTEVSRGRDEVSQLMAAFGMMSRELSELVSAICGSTGKVQGAAGSLDTSVDNMAEVASQQLEAVRSIAGTVSHFSEQSQQAAATTSQAREQVEQAKHLAGQGQQLIERATAEFDVISDSIKRSAEAVDTLRDRSVAVRNLVTTVREIAEQTNLLALNAAIEAARAGESGRGFSVVADEVRNLASRTGTATEEINQVIDAMEGETQVSVERISSGREELERGVSLLREMVQPLSDLNAGAKASAEQLALLETAVATQAQDSELIDVQVQQIREMTAGNQETIDYISEATDGLAELSEVLEGEVGRFDLNEHAMS
ncbi:MAG: methyl-accepting chemotaxis protein [Pseudomonadales bacterium]